MPLKAKLFISCGSPDFQTCPLTLSSMCRGHPVLISVGVTKEAQNVVRGGPDIWKSGVPQLLYHYQVKSKLYYTKQFLCF